MLDIDSAFDEKALGFKSFTAFVKAVDGIELVQDDKTWSAFFQDSEASPGPLPKKPKKATPSPQEIDLAETYRIILRIKHWRSIPASVLARCYSKMRGVGALPKSELLETVVRLCDGEVTTTDARKAAGLLLKAGIMEVRGANEEGEVMWQVPPLSEPEVLYAVDRAMMVRLLAGREDTRSPMEKRHLAPLCLGKHSGLEIDTLLKEASSLGRDGGGQD